jgi:hypothetical protein
MKRLVPESLDQFINEAKDWEAAKDQRKIEKKGLKPKKLDQSAEEKATQAISALKKELADAKKPGAFKTNAQKEAKIKELEAKIAKWEAKK